MMNNRQNPYKTNAPRVKVASKSAATRVAPVVLLGLGVVVLLINGAYSGI